MDDSPPIAISMPQSDQSTSTRFSLTLSSLPSEIHAQILHHLLCSSSTPSLKLFRLSNSSFRSLADQHLFHTLHVSASTASLARLTSISNTPHLAIHVRELVFHRGTFFGHKMARAARSFENRARDYDDFETYVVRSSRGEGGMSPGLMRISECYANFQEELGFETRFNMDMSWRSTLRGPCARFTRLEGVRTLASEYDLESGFLRRRCALTHQSWTPNYFAPYEIIEVCGREWKPKWLGFDSVNGEDFANVILNVRGGEVKVREKFSELKGLRLSFSETVSMLEVEGTWDIFVRCCWERLETLSLDFTSFFSLRMLKESESFPQKVIKLFLGQTFPRLREVDLTYALMTEDDFVGFLERHADALRKINLCRWPIPVTGDLQPTGSVIRTFWKMGRMDMKQLTSVRVNGEFSNRADGEGWTACPLLRNVGKEMNLGSDVPVREKLERYMLGVEGAIWPFPMDEIRLIKAKMGDELATLEKLPFECGLGDGSFEWWEKAQ